MPISPAEQADLDKLQTRLNDIRRNAFDAMSHCIEATPEDLKHSGHKTNEGKLMSSFKYYLKQCDQEIKQHIKKWPD